MLKKIQFSRDKNGEIEYFFNINQFKIMDAPCYICERELDEVCPTCKDSGANIYECCFARGECGCTFHFHCIAAALKRNNSCPRCHFSSSENPKGGWDYARFIQRRPAFPQCISCGVECANCREKESPSKGKCAGKIK